MKRTAWIALSIATPLLMAFIFNSNVVFAGPPLLCHPIEIGDAKSLPWGNGAWQDDKITSKDADFVSQTLALLSTDATVLTRMETIRRAAIHAAEHPVAATDLMAAIRLRVANDDSPDEMQLFDLGYLAATYSQMNMVTEHNETGYAGGNRKGLVVPAELSAYDLLRKASEMANDDAAIEFALALLTQSPTHPAHQTHLQNAIAGAPEESLLATNLVRRFGRDGQTLADLKTSLGMAADGERR